MGRRSSRQVLPKRAASIRRSATKSHGRLREVAYRTLLPAPFQYVIGYVRRIHPCSPAADSGSARQTMHIFRLLRIDLPQCMTDEDFARGGLARSGGGVKAGFSQERSKCLKKSDKKRRPNLIGLRPSQKLIHHRQLRRCDDPEPQRPPQHGLMLLIVVVALIWASRGPPKTHLLLYV